MPASPKTAINLLAGLMLGFGIGLGAALTLAKLDTLVRDADDISKLVASPVLSSIPFDPESSTAPLVVTHRPSSQHAEAIRKLRTNLKFVNSPGGLKTIVVTSSLPGEGKSTTAINLALAIADTESRVLLIDADLRRPTIAKITGLEGAVGLTTVLIGQAEASDVIQPLGKTALSVLCSGEVPPNPSELLGSAQMSRLLDDLTHSYDYIVLDSAPLLPVTDGAILSTMVDGALIVVGANTANRQQVAASVEALQAVGARLLGLVVNLVARGTTTAYEYYSHEAASNKAIRSRASRPARR